MFVISFSHVKRNMSTITKLLLVRHGETSWNAEGKMQGQLDTDLNAVGRLQAEAAAKWLGQQDFRGEIDMIYSSDLRRAFDTASAIGNALGVPIVMDPRLRETNLGVWQGSTWDEVIITFREQVHRWKTDASYAMPEGESVRERFYRVSSALHQIALAHPGRTVIIVSHGGAVDDAGRLAQGVPFSESTRLRKANTCMCTLHFEHDTSKLAIFEETISADAAPSERAAALASAAFPDHAMASITPEDASRVLGEWRIVSWGQLDHLHAAGLPVPAAHRHTIGGPVSEDLQRHGEGGSGAAGAADACHDDVGNLRL